MLLVFTVRITKGARQCIFLGLGLLTRFADKDLHLALATRKLRLVAVPRLFAHHTRADDLGHLGRVRKALVKGVVFPQPIPAILGELVEVPVNAALELENVLHALVAGESVGVGGFGEGE